MINDFLDTVETERCGECANLGEGFPDSGIALYLSRYIAHGVTDQSFTLQLQISGSAGVYT